MSQKHLVFNSIRVFTSINEIDSVNKRITMFGKNLIPNKPNTKNIKPVYFLRVLNTLLCSLRVFDDTVLFFAKVIKLAFSQGNYPWNEAET